MKNCKDQNILQAFEIIKLMVLRNRQLPAPNLSFQEPSRIPSKLDSYFLSGTSGSVGKRKKISQRIKGEMTQLITGECQMNKRQLKIIFTIKTLIRNSILEYTGCFMLTALNKIKFCAFRLPCVKKDDVLTFQTFVFIEKTLAFDTVNFQKQITRTRVFFNLTT